MARSTGALGKIVGRDGVPGAIAEARVEGAGVWRGTAGHGDPGAGTPRRTEERFRAGSVTKAFVAATALHLAGEGVLELDAPVTTWLPDARLDGITLRHLLGHGSGLYDYTRDPAMHRRLTSDFLDHRTRSYTPEELVEIALGHPPGFAPGRGWAYCNTGYVLAGMVIGRATGGDFREQVRARVIEPLGLSGTSLPGDDPGLPEPHARHYSRLSLPIPFRGTREVTLLNPSAGGASGELISTLDDLTRFLAALLRGELLPPRLLAEMLTPVPHARGTHGLGMKFRKLPAGLVAGYDGAIHGSITSVFGTPDGRVAVALNVNSDWQDEAAMTALLVNAALEDAQ
ncbi:MAG: beta-lactamase family protein [Nonomuraea sp.]|nr:beta-lactamase family protein [Nonomuraea sp.]